MCSASSTTSDSAPSKHNIIIVNYLPYNYHTSSILFRSNIPLPACTVSIIAGLLGGIILVVLILCTITVPLAYWYVQKKYKLAIATQVRYNNILITEKTMHF